MWLELVYALPEEQKRYRFQAPLATTVEEAIDLSGIISDRPDLPVHEMAIGVWGKRVALDYPLQEEDRVEIYRSLLIDPKQVRQSLVKKERKGRKRSFYPILE